MPGHEKISYVQNDEPSFIKQFKQRVGYKEESDVNTKRQVLQQPGDVEDRPDADDEKPVVVVLQVGDLTAEEAHVAEAANKDTDDQVDAVAEDKKITFKKPGKRSNTESSDLNASSMKKTKDSAIKDETKAKSKSDIKQVKNTQLLSFTEDDDEEGDS